MFDINNSSVMVSEGRFNQAVKMLSRPFGAGVTSYDESSESAMFDINNSSVMVSEGRVGGEPISITGVGCKPSSTLASDYIPDSFINRLFLQHDAR